MNRGAERIPSCTRGARRLIQQDHFHFHGFERYLIHPHLCSPRCAVSCYALAALCLATATAQELSIAYRPQLLYSNVSPKLRIQGTGFTGAYPSRATCESVVSTVASFRTGGVAQSIPADHVASSEARPLPSPPSGPYTRSVYGFVHCREPKCVPKCEPKRLAQARCRRAQRAHASVRAIDRVTGTGGDDGEDGETHGRL